MSSSTVDLSSLLQALYGSQSAGINVNSAVTAALTAARKPEIAWQTQQNTLQNQGAAINMLQSEVTSLSDDLSALTDPLGAMTAMTTSSSNSSVVSASATSAASIGTHAVVVTNLASTASWYSDAVSSSSTLATGSLQIQVGTGASTTINVGSSNSTLSGLASSINSASLGVTASVITDAQGSRLAVVSNSSGSASDISITNDTTDANFLQFHQAAQGKNAALTVDGIPVSSATNTVTGVLTGVTLNLTGTSGSEVNLTVGHDTAKVAAAVSSFVSDYNTVMKAVNAQFAADSTGSSGALANDTNARMLQTDLLSAMSYTGSSLTMGALGISMNNDGTLTLDTTKLNSTLQSNFDGVSNFLKGTANNGFAAKLDDSLQTYIDTTSGAFTLDLQSLRNEYNDLQKQIDNFETYTITPMQQALTDSYNKAEMALMSMPSQQQQLNTELGYNTGKN